MKLILREYLLALKERNELDSLLPDLLSQMGLRVFSTPMIGPRQYGVDVAAVGQLGEMENSVYLFTVKPGDIKRSDWSDSSSQGIKQSLDDILQTYIPTHLPSELGELPVKVCICIGGEIKQDVRQTVSSYEKFFQTEQVSFEEWDGEKLSNLISEHFLAEELMPKEKRFLLRKSIALIEDPELSYESYAKLVRWLCGKTFKSDKEALTHIRQLNISLWILFSWCREANNVDAAYLASEVALLNAWEIAKPYTSSKSKVPREILNTFSLCLNTYHTITNEFLEKCVTPHVGKKHSISNAVRANCKFDVSLKLFDILSRLGVQGIWLSNEIRKQGSEDEGKREELISSLHQAFEAIKQLIVNNPVLMAPFKDDQAIDLSIAIYCLSLDEENIQFIKDWLGEMVYILRHSYQGGRAFPTVNLDYAQLINIEESKTKEQLEELTRSSISYPLIGVIASLLEMDEIKEVLSDFCENSLKHCEMQYWYPLADTEKFLYTNKGRHGGVLHPIDLVRKNELLLEQVFSECVNTDYFEGLTAVSEGLEPLVTIACRHYRYPLPMHFFLDDYELFKQRANAKS
ncbi:hypothetical protein CWC29_009935 [Pseudoalteromonas sp. S4498]|uniref:hypothetical protein n=1 Tax=Pseudoalteromonas galatheae TaxID=579562 RepID=UPI001109732B|nr:hypothetical protein [Pseudoalteromonas galatheae]NKC19157.1 hypothetical protein [Pseudoalteromonas galatheae]